MKLQVPPKVKFVKRQINWLALIPKLLVIGIACMFFYPLDKQFFFVFAFVIYWLLTALAREIFFPISLRKSIELIALEKFEEAIPYTQKTIDYYLNHRWIDKYRFILLINSSKKTITESITCNLAYCYFKTGRIGKAQELYHEILKHYPRNTNARAMLHAIEPEKISILISK